METSRIKIQFNQKPGSKDPVEPLMLTNAGHLVFNVPERFTETEISRIKNFPLFSLSLKNQSELYRVGSSFVADIENDKKQFAFVSFSGLDDNHLLTFGSFINYTLKRSVLLVVKDLNDKSWDKYRKHFSAGTLWKWNCHDWEDLCLIDYNEISKTADCFNALDFSSVTNEFAAVLWSLPVGDLSKYIPKNAISILHGIQSVTLTLCQGQTCGEELKETIAYYNCFNIPVKGVLMEAEQK